MRSPIAMWNAFLHRTGLRTRRRNAHRDKGRPDRRAPQVEPLEPRQLLATIPHAETFDDGVANDFQVQEGDWDVVVDQGDGEYYCDLETGDYLVASTLNVTESLPYAYRAQTIMYAMAGGGGLWSNAFVIFDYQSPSDYKFAGCWQGENAWAIGRSDGSDDHETLASFSSTVNAEQLYRATLWVEGTTAMLYVNGIPRVSYDFTGEDLTDGEVGVGAINAKAHFDNFTLKESNLPFSWTFHTNQDDYFWERNGKWSNVSYEYLSEPQGSINYQISTVRLSEAVPQAYEMEANMRSATASGLNKNGYFVFDYEDPENFKFAGGFVGANYWSVGKVVNGTGTHLAQDFETINVNQNYDIKIEVDDETVTLYADGQQKTSYQFTGETLNDNPIGIGATYAKTYFDDISVTWVNSAPEVADPIANVTVNEDAVDSVLDLSDVFFDPDVPYWDGLTLSVTGNTNPSLVDLDLDGTDLTLDYLQNQYGTAYITIRATDEESEYIEDTFLVTVNSVPDAPVAVTDAYTWDETKTFKWYKTSDTAKVIDNDIDVDGDSLTLTAVTDPSHGWIQWTEEGEILYAPFPGYNGSDTFDYTIDDGTGRTDTGTVNITLTAVNYDPSPMNDAYLLTPPGSPGTLVVSAANGMLANDTDVNGDNLTVASISEAPSNGTLSAWGSDGSFTYVPGGSFPGTDEFTYKASDGAGGEEEATVYLTTGTIFHIAAVDTSVEEGDSAEFTVTRSGDTSQEQQINYQVITVGYSSSVNDFSSDDAVVWGTVTFAAGDTEETVFIETRNNEDGDNSGRQGSPADEESFAVGIGFGDENDPIGDLTSGGMAVGTNLAEMTLEESTDPPVYDCGCAFTVPGDEGQTYDVTFTATSNAGFNNEFGIFYLDSPCGDVDGDTPGDSGFPTSALSQGNYEVVFASGSLSTTPAQATVSIDADRYFSLYSIQNGTTADYLNPNDDLPDANGNPDTTAWYAWFCHPGANVDGGSAHFIRLDDEGDPGYFHFGVEDLSADHPNYPNPNGNPSDEDFNDVVVEFSIPVPELIPPCGPCGQDAAQISETGVSYGTGNVGQAVGAGCGTGTCGDIGHSLSYDNTNASPVDAGNGNNWSVGEWPHLEMPSCGDVYAIFNSQRAFWFRSSDDGFSAQFGAKQMMTYDSATDIFRMVEPDGTIYEFYGFCQDDEPKGSLKGIVSPGGQTTEVTGYNSDGYAEGFEQEFPDNSANLTNYTYYTSGENAGRLQYVTYQRRAAGGSPTTDIQRLSFDYYVASDTGGSAGDLKTATLQYPDQSGWDDIGTHFYRYYTDSAGGKGFQYGLKNVLLPEAYRQLVKDGHNPMTVSDSTLANYTCYLYEYDSSQRVNKVTLFGGSRTFLYSYTTNTDDYQRDHNQWRTKTVEARPDGSQYTVYTNFLGQVLLTKLTDSGGSDWITHREYGIDGQVKRIAAPSAIDMTASPIYDDTEGDLDVQHNAQAGLVQSFQYYDAADLPTGGVDGYLQYSQVQQGWNGTPEINSEYLYSPRVGTFGTLTYSMSDYVSHNGAEEITTSYALQYATGTHQVSQRTATLPAVAVAENGSGTSATMDDVYDVYGNLTWSRDERGFISYNEYDLLTGNLVQSIADVDDALVTGEPSGWETPDGGGQHLVMDYTYDALGRTTQVLGPEHWVDIGGVNTKVRTASWTIYHDVSSNTDWAREVWSAQGYATHDGSGWNDLTLINPVSITAFDADGRTLEQIQSISQQTVFEIDPSDTSEDEPHEVVLAGETFTQAEYTGWSINTYSKTQLVSTQVYHDIPATGSGSEGDNYDTTEFAYDSLGRIIRNESPGGTITRPVYDARGLTLETWVGTNDDGATAADPSGGSDPDNNMKKLVANVYDGGSEGGNGLLTQTTQYVDDTTTRQVKSTYDWRGRTEFTIAPDDDQGDFTYTHVLYDGLDRVIQTDSYLDDGDDVLEPWNGQTPGDDTLLGRSETAYDDRGRVFQTTVYGVDPSDGSVGESLVSHLWYDAAGNVVKSQPGGSHTFTKTQYDGLGRAVDTFVGYDVDEMYGETGYAYSQVLDVTGDTVVEQATYQYDEVGNTIFVTSRQREHDATGTGELQGPGTTQPVSRDTFVATWSDPLGRQVAVADFGTGGGSTPTRTATIPTASTTDMLVSKVEYNSEGEVSKTIGTDGIESQTSYDDAGRPILTIDNYADGDPETGDSAEDVTLQFTYNADGLQDTMTALNYAPRYGAPGSGVQVDTSKGDLDDDDDKDADDIDALVALIGSGTYDVDGDGGTTDWQDVDAMVRSVVEIRDGQGTVIGHGTEHGDLDLDGAVDYSDLAYFAAGFLDYGTWSDGDFDGDGYVGWADLAIFESYFGFPDEHTADANTQTTYYNYGTTLEDNGVARSDLLRSVVYPESDDVRAGNEDEIYDRVEYRYNRLGQRIEIKDQNETVHTYTYDHLGRLEADSVTLATGSDIDDGVLRIGYSYDVRGLLEKVTSYSDAAGTTVVNEVEYAYNDFAQVTTVSQEHDGAVDANSLAVVYNYADADEGLRLDSIDYPSGNRTVDYEYGTSGQMNDILNRLETIEDDGTTLASYEYLGLGTIVTEDFEEIDVRLSLALGGTGETYNALDHFGRVIDQVWEDYGSSTTLDEFRYGYDLAGNRLYRENVVAGTNNVHLDELYEYDDANRLTGVERGNLNASQNGIVSGTEALTQDWELDALGNWSWFNEDTDGDGTSDLDQFRGTNAANEIVEIAESSGQDEWADAAYDRAGNMTAMPQPGDPENGLTAKYDAWNRLVSASIAGNEVGQYEYDGLGRRVFRAFDRVGMGTGIEDSEHYIYDGQRVLETRAGGTAYITYPADNLQPRYQYVWSPRYIDALILRDENTDLIPFQGDDDCDDGRIYYLSDANMNVSAIVYEASPGDWQIRERYVYDPYGQVTIYNDDWSATHYQNVSFEDNVYLYTGRRLDTETGLYFYRARYFNPALGTFVSRDPKGYPDGPNSYAAYFVPNFLDPTGLVKIFTYPVTIGGRLLKIEFNVIVSDAREGYLAVTVVLRRMLESYLEAGDVENYAESVEKYRKAWNRRMRGGTQWPGRGIYSSGGEERGWNLPNLALVLHGEDHENEYGGSYWTGEAPQFDINGDLEDFGTEEYHPDDDFLWVNVTAVDLQNQVCGEAKTKSWEPNTELRPGEDPKTTIVDKAISKRVFVKRCECGTLTVSLDYPDARYGGNYGKIVVPYDYRPGGGGLGEPRLAGEDEE